MTYHTLILSITLPLCADFHAFSRFLINAHYLSLFTLSPFFKTCECFVLLIGVPQLYHNISLLPAIYALHHEKGRFFTCVDLWLPISLDSCLCCEDVIKSKLVYAVPMRRKIRPKRMSAAPCKKLPFHDPVSRRICCERSTQSYDE